jgi:hypothetical protein
MIRLQRILAHGRVLLLGTAIFFVQGPSFVRHPGDQLADAGDSLLNTWILAWDARALAGGENVWDAPFYYPARNTFAFSENMFGNLWLTLPVQALTGNPVLAFNSLVLASFVLGMYCTFLLVRSLTGNDLAGIVSGILFSFNPFRWSEIPHIQLLPFFWAPLALLLAHRFLETQRRRYAVGLLATLVAQYYTSIYLGTILMITTAVFAGIHWLVERRGKARWVFFVNLRLAATLVVGGVLAALALLPLATPYLRTARDWDFVRTQADNASFSCEPLSYFVPNGSFRSYAWLHDALEGKVRGHCGLGIVPWLLAGLGLLVAGKLPLPMTPIPGAARDENCGRVARRFAWTALVMAILMLGPCLIWFNQQHRFPLPYFLVYHLVPGGKAMRVPARFIFPLLLCLSVLAGFAVAHGLNAWRRWRPGARLLVGAALAALLALDYRVADNPGVLCEPPDRFPSVYAYLAAGDRDGPVLELPAAIGGQFRYLYYQTAHWRPLLGGESGSFTPAALETAKRTQGAPTAQTLRFLELTPAQTLVIHLDNYAGAEREAWRTADPAPHGFRLAGQFGNALIWERVASLPQSVARLRITHADLQLSRAFLRDRLDITLVLAPAGGDPWRSLERGLSHVTIEVVDSQGNVQQFTKPFTIPPYLLAGETASVQLDKVRGPFASATRVRLRGPLIEPFEATLDSRAGPQLVTICVKNL